MTKTKECRKKKSACPFLLFENSRPLSPPWEPQIPFSSLVIQNFLSTCLDLSHLPLSKLCEACGMNTSSYDPQSIQHVSVNSPIFTDKVKLKFQSLSFVAIHRLALQSYLLPLSESSSFIGQNVSFPFWTWHLPFPVCLHCIPSSSLPN